MRILTLLKYATITGVGTWNYTFLKAIKEKYPSIDIHFHIESPTTDSKLIRELSKFATFHTKLPTDSFDIVYTNYEVNELPDAKNVYHFIHSLMSNNFYNPYATKYFTFGERAAYFIQERFGKPSSLIRNAIDLNRFSFQEPSKKLEKVMNFDGRNSAFNNSALLATCSDMKLFFAYLGADYNYETGLKWDVENYLKNADLVTAIGRSAIEAMAMGKATIILNYSHSTGLVTPDNFFRQAETNFSGWIGELKKDEPGLVYYKKEFKKYNSEDAYILRQLIEEHYNINKYIDILL